MRVPSLPPEVRSPNTRLWAGLVGRAGQRQPASTCGRPIAAPPHLFTAPQGDHDALGTVGKDGQGACALLARGDAVLHAKLQAPRPGAAQGELQVGLPSSKGMDASPQHQGQRNGRRGCWGSRHALLLHQQ